MQIRHLLIGALLLSGCGDADSPPSDQPVTQTPAEPDAAAASAETPESAAVAATVMSAEETGRLIASHTGKVVVLDLWALW